MLDILSPPILGLIFIALVIAVVIVVIIRRRRAQSSTDGVMPIDIGQPVDYTSMTVEEPTNLVDRFRNLSPAMRALALLVPLILIGGLIVLAMGMSNPGSANEPPLAPQVPAAELAITRAEVVGTGKIVVVGTTNLPNDAQVSVLMKEDGQEYFWFDTATAISRPNSGQLLLTLDRLNDAPIPTQDREYTITLITVGGSSVSSPPVKLNVLEPFKADFYQLIAEVATAEPEPTAEAAATSEPVPEPTSAIPGTEPVATVIGGGKIRSEPSVQGSEVGQIAKGDNVTLIARTEDGAWFRVRAGDNEGWVSSTLLEVAPDIAANVPTPQPASTLNTTVFNGGNVRAEPSLDANVLDQINAGESVQLLEKSSNEQWYKITNVRGVTGWVNRTLLNLSVELTRAVPTTGSGGSTIVQPTSEPGASTGLTATVFNGGNVRSAPNRDGQVLDQINARETVQLLAKNADGTWYQITNTRGITGWVSVTLLTIDADLASKVPVAK
jgi:uncharacterized protein YgiM (DUF1202 family)